MPDIPEPKARPHPWKIHADDGEQRITVPPSTVTYTNLATTSNFTFLTGASHPEELVQTAAALGHSVATITDRNTLAGIVRAHVAAKEAGIPLAVGCRVVLADPPDLSMLVFPTKRSAYAGLCRMLTLGKRRTDKGQCNLTLHDVLEHQEDWLVVFEPPTTIDQSVIEAVAGLHSVVRDRLWIAVTRLYTHHDPSRIDLVEAFGEHIGAPLVITNDTLYHDASRRALQDVLTCIKHGCTLEQAGLNLEPHAERRLKTGEEMRALFDDRPWVDHAIAASVEVGQRASAFSLDELRYEYPHEVCPPGIEPIDHLTVLTWQGAKERYPGGVPEDVQRNVRHELELIRELNYAPYFLTCHDLVVFARSRGILCQGRGAAANSAVCYCLGVTAVDPDRVDLLFERFVSKERDEPPDIDIDFEHERREEVIQYIYRKYTRERAALTAEVISYRGRSAIREVGKALGLSLDCVDQLAKSRDWWDNGATKPDRLRELGINPDDRTIRLAIELAGQIIGFPRHLSQHVGGFVITRSRLSDYVPIENAAMPDRTVIEWDKDDIDAMGMLKVDVLGLGMLTCIRKALEFVNERRTQPLQLHTVPPEDPEVYDMICRADTIGVFQIESRAQMQMLPRLRPRCYYDLVIEVAIVRPGPIQGDMVHPYLRRRHGEEPVTYPNEKVERVLGKTLGVPLFQEQAMQMAIVAAGFTPGEADQLRRAMASWKRSGNKILAFGRKLVDGMLANGYERAFAERCFEQLKGFSEYGFPESHAASFALLVYVSCWLKWYHPEAFAAALINSQPMGFYRPAQIIRDAREHDVEVRSIDVNHSAWDCSLEETDGERRAIRLGTRLVKGLSQLDADAITEAVETDGPFASIDELRRTSRVQVRAFRSLARADAFRSMGLDRQAALWHIQQLRDEYLPIFEQQDVKPTVREIAAEQEADPQPTETYAPPPLPLPTQVAHDYAATGLSLTAHPVSFIRAQLDKLGVTPCGELHDPKKWPHGKRVAVAGLTLVRQRPGTASGIVFVTLEDESGVANLIVRPKIFDRDRRAARHAIVMIARGTIERGGPNKDVVHIMVRRVEDAADRITSITTSLDNRSRDFH